MNYGSFFEIAGEKIAVKDREARELITRITDEGAVVLIGDSYGKGYTPQGTVASWIDLIKKDFTKCYTSAIDGSGFLNGTTFLQQLINLSANIKEDVKLIIVGGGYNDKGYAQSYIIAAISTFASYVKERFPRAKVIVAEMGWGVDLHSRTDVHNNVFQSYAVGCAANNFTYSAACTYPLHDYNLFSSDGFHPNANGQIAITNALRSIIKTGTYDWSCPWHLIHIAPITNFGTPEADYLGISISKDQVNINIRPIQFAVNNVTLEGGKFRKIGELPTDVLSGYSNDSPFCAINVPTWAQDNTGHYYSFNAMLVFNSLDKGVYLYITNVQPDGSGYFKLLNTKAMRFMGAQATLPAYLC